MISVSHSKAPRAKRRVLQRRSCGSGSTLRGKKFRPRVYRVVSDCVRLGRVLVSRVEHRFAVDSLINVHLIAIIVATRVMRVSSL